MRRLRVVVVHVAVGVPLAALLHSILQFAHDPTAGPADAGLFAAHFLLGTFVGSVVLVPAYAAQAGLLLLLGARGARRASLVLAGGLFQAALVLLWSLVVGIEPSLAGRFRLTPPMVGAGFLAGALVARLALAAEPQPPGREVGNA